MSIHESVKAGIPDALKTHNEALLRTLRSLTTAMTNEAVAKKRKPNEFLSDEEALTVLKRAANQRKDSITQFEQAGRPELATPEYEELNIIESYLPAQLSREEIEKVAKAKVAELNLSSKSDSGKLTGLLMKEFKGEADGSLVKEVVDSLLS